MTLGWIWASVALAAPASEPCAEVEDGMASGPVVAGLVDGDLGRGRRVCGRDELGWTAGALLTVDTPNFYGHIVGGLTLDGSWRVQDRTELFATLEAIRYDTVISALSSGYLGLGHTSIGAAQRLNDGPIAFGLNGKVVLPTALGLYRHSRPFAADLGLAGAWQGTGAFRLHGQVGLLTSAAASRGPTQARLGVCAVLGTELRPGKVFAAVVDVASSFAYTSAVDAVAIAPAVRFSDGKRWGLELGATVPLAGRERALATVDLRNSIRLGAR